MYTKKITYLTASFHRFWLLPKAMQWPKAAAQLETVDSEDDVQPAPRGATKVLKCVAEVSVS